MPPERVGARVTCGVLFVVKVSIVPEVVRLKNLPDGQEISHTNLITPPLQDNGGKRLTLHVLLPHLFQVHIFPKRASEHIQRPCPRQLRRYPLILVEIVLCKAGFRIVICVGRISYLERTSGTYPRIDSLRHRASLALEPKNLLGAVDTNGRAGEVDENT